MKVTLIMVMSLDGKTTRGDEQSIYHWSSSEDSDFFFSLLAKQNLVIMGKHTYLAAKPIMKLTPAILRVVLTHTPSDFASEAVEGQLQFTSQDVAHLMHDLEQQGYTNALLVGGASVNAAFFAHNLISDIYVTIEPFVFGLGNTFVVPAPLDVPLTLESVKQLNAKGTLLLHYLVDPKKASA